MSGATRTWAVRYRGARFAAQMNAAARLGLEWVDEPDGEGRAGHWVARDEAHAKKMRSLGCEVEAVPA